MHPETAGLPVMVSPVPSVRQGTARESPEIFRKASQALQTMLQVLVL